MKTTVGSLALITWGQEFTPEDERRSRWTFKASHEDTLAMLEREVALLGGESYHLEVDIPANRFLKDGSRPHADAPQPKFPGVRISFESDRLGPLSYQSDSCETWQHNVRSVAKGMEALRGVERFGISKRDQQYVGFKELSSGTAMGASSTPTMTRGQAYELVYNEAGVDTGSIVLLTAWKRAVRKAHPDTSTGSAERWEKLERAGHILGIS